MKVCFLDIDGVLNYAEYGEDTYYDKYCDKEVALDDLCIKRLRKLLERFPDLKIVWSTDWRFINEDSHFPWKSPEVRAKIESRNLELYGTTYGPGTFAKYQYDGEWFDGSWELAYRIWCKENKKNIKKSPYCFEYEVVGVDGKLEKHKYWPDFEVDGQLVEIKGDQFFTEDGKSMRCPYRKKEWSDEFCAHMNRIYDAKFQCMLANHVTIMRSSDIVVCINYVNEKYGSRYLKKFIKKINRTSRRGLSLQKRKNEIQ